MILLLAQAKSVEIMSANKKKLITTTIYDPF